MNAERLLDRSLMAKFGLENKVRKQEGRCSPASLTRALSTSLPLPGGELKLMGATRHLAQLIGDTNNCSSVGFSFLEQRTNRWAHPLFICLCSRSRWLQRPLEWWQNWQEVSRCILHCLHWCVSFSDHSHWRERSFIRAGLGNSDRIGKWIQAS